MTSITSSSIQQFDCDPSIESLGPKWTKWVTRLDQYFAANGITDDARKFNSLFFIGGEDLFEIHQTLVDMIVPDTINTEYGKAKHKLSAYFSPKKNTVVEIYNFRQAKQNPNESISQYVTRLRMLGQFCEFANLNQEIITHVIQTCYSENLRREFLKMDTLNYDDFIKIGRLHDNVEENAKIVEGKLEIKEEAVNKITDNWKNNKKKCFRCGRDWPHKEKSCPAIGKTCSKCKQANHLANVCRSKIFSQSENSKTANAKETNDKINQILQNNGENDSEEEEIPIIYSLTSTHKKFPELEFVLNDEKIKLKIDTLASINVIDEKTFKQFLNKPTLTKVVKQSYAYGSKEPIQTIGKFSAKLKILNKEIDAEFVVTKGDSGSLIGFPSCSKLGVDPVAQIVNSIQTNNVESDFKDFYKSKYPNVFSDKIGKLKDFQLTLHIDKSIKPTQAKPRNIPFHLREAVEKQLKIKIENEIIEKVENEPTSWLSETVRIPKKDSQEIRLCIDTTAVNAAILSEKYQMPNIEDIIYASNGMKFFSKIDLNSAFEQIELHPDSRYISRFRTHQGIYQYKRLFFGIKSAPEIFHNLIKQILEGIKNQINASDDILIMGKTLNDHNEALEKVLKRLDEKGLTVKLEKCEFRKSSIIYFGLEITENSVSLNKQKTEALKDTKTPRNASELHSFLGLSVHASRWIKNFATISDPLWDLLKKDKIFKWTNIHQSSFEKIKDGLIESVGHFDINWKTQLTVDASPVGVAAVLTQTDPNNSLNSKVIIYVSKSLNPTQRKYSQIEKEAYACVWSCERLELYLVGIFFDLIIDNKAVFLILKNPLSNPPARIQRWALRLSSFNFNVIHRPGIGNIADFLSRHPNKSLSDDYEDDAEDFLNMVIAESLPEAMTKELIAEETIKDKNLVKLSKMISASHFVECDDLKDYKKIFDELTLSKEKLILRGSRIVIPESLYDQAIKLAHEGHQGLVKTKQLLRSRVWFPKMNKLLEDYYKRCTCQAVINTYSKMPNEMSPLPEEPWTVVSIDFYGPIYPTMENLLVHHCDHSRMAFIDIITSKTHKVVINRCNRLYSIVGIPEIVRSDNGPPFNSKEFADFAKHMGFKHRKITPYWPQANGQVESFMKKIKKAIQTAKVDQVPWKDRLIEFMRAYRSTKHSTTNIPPADLFFKKSNTVRLPKLNDIPKDSVLEEILKVNDKLNKSKMKLNADKKAKFLNIDYSIGDLVLVKRSQTNKTVSVFDPVPYAITSISGSMITAKRDNTFITRNISFFKKFYPQIPKPPLLMQVKQIKPFKPKIPTVVIFESEINVERNEDRDTNDNRTEEINSDSESDRNGQPEIEAENNECESSDSKQSSSTQIDDQLRMNVNSIAQNLLKFASNNRQERATFEVNEDGSLTQIDSDFPENPNDIRIKATVTAYSLRRSERLSSKEKTNYKESKTFNKSSNKN
ncbi:unnamed protein product [Brachionus calyciflorus]|uniref:RNA-directed DNA polymerase n=1 Tax=Brachionus calyciflorus TaxID=104777 RepID=A0A814JX67_9BILA|nr:unnamed protein product [Brachionus calyciflorus]